MVGIIAAIMVPAKIAAAAPSPAKALPEAVSRFLERREQCDHWLGEEPYDAARARQIAKAVSDLDCARIDRDEAVLRKRHAGQAAIIAALDASL